MKYVEGLVLWICLLALKDVRGTAPENGQLVADFRFNDTYTGKTKLCVSCLQRDFEKSLVESECVDKYSKGILSNETIEWNGNMETFFPVCGTLQSTIYPRYIKNCTAAPYFPGVKVNCSDKHGRQLYRVHDTCQVECTGPRMKAYQPLTTCDPVTATWTVVTCLHQSCAPLQDSKIIEKTENSSCNVSQDQPLDKICDVTCPEGYDPPVRVVKCLAGEWTLVSKCAPLPKRSPTHTDEEKSLIPLIVGLCAGVVFLIIAIILGRYCWRQYILRHGSSTDVSQETEDPDPEKDSLMSSSVSDDQTAKQQINMMAELISSPRSEVNQDITSDPPAYTSHTSWGGFEMEKLYGAGAACTPAFYYKINDELPEQPLPNSHLRLTGGTLLTLLARCENGHQITQFNYGPFFNNNNCQLFRYGVSVVIVHGDEGMYVLAAQCDRGGQVITQISIQLTDVTGNPEHTEPKYPVPCAVHLESLDSTVTQPSLTACGEPSSPLKAQPNSLPSNPNLAALIDSHKTNGSQEPQHNSNADYANGDDADAIDDAVDAEGKTKGREGNVKAAVSRLSLVSQMSVQESNDPTDDCTLPLVKLRTEGSLKDKFDNLCLQLEPLSCRLSVLTIEGLTSKTLGYSQDKLDHIIWAKREDLRNSPARVLLMMMMQAGKKASDVVTYFWDSQHRNTEVIELLISIHPNCPVCQQYR